MPSGHEVLTLQFGSYANYIGAHYWNIQDELLGLQEQQSIYSNEIDSSILYREGQTLSGDSTYTPRLILFDNRGSFGSLTPQGTLYPSLNTASAPPTWSGRSQVNRSEPIDKPLFQQHLENELSTYQEHPDNVEQGPSPLEQSARELDAPGSVRYFTDYLKAHYHPRSACLVSATHNTDSHSTRNSTTSSSWLDHERAEARELAEDRIRVSAEECDSLSGFQCIVDENATWGGLAALVLQDIKDEYPGRATTLFAVRPPSDTNRHQEDQTLIKKEEIERSLFLAALAPHSNLYIPLAAPSNINNQKYRGIQYRAGDWFHESALCAAAVDSATLPYRLTIASPTAPSGAVGGINMWSMSQLVTAQRASPLAALRMSLPCPSLPHDSLIQGLDHDTRLLHQQHSDYNNNEDLLATTMCMTPLLSSNRCSNNKQKNTSSSRDEDCFAECIVLRGARKAGEAASVSNASSELDEALLREGIRSVKHRVVTGQALALPLPFPRLFYNPPIVSRYGDMHGYIGSNSKVVEDILSCPVLSRLSGSGAFREVVSTASERVKRAWQSGYGQTAVEAWGWGKDEQEECAEVLSEMVNAYDDDDDDE